MKKLTTEQIITLSNTLASSKLGSMPTDDKYKVIHAMRVLREHVSHWQDFVKDAQSRLDKAELETVAAKELVDLKEVELPSLSTAAIGALMESNPEWTGAMIDFIDEMLHETDNEQK